MRCLLNASPTESRGGGYLKINLVFETGSKCPCSVKGEILIQGVWYKMQRIDLGTGENRLAADCGGTAACWNSVVNIKQVRFGWDARDYDWTFKKQ
jgi:hypothetical protein